jgi:tRNA(fMet)-specific endonuclease VapC
MMSADSDVLIDYLRGRAPWAARIRLEIKAGRLGTTAINSFELLSGAKDNAEHEKVSRLRAALHIVDLTPAASEQAAAARRDLESHGQGIGMADCLVASISPGTRRHAVDPQRGSLRSRAGLKVSGQIR